MQCFGMNLISTASTYWQADCYNAAEKGVPFYVPNVSPDNVDFLAGLGMRFPHPKLWSGNTFFFNPPMDPKFVG